MSLTAFPRRLLAALLFLAVLAGCRPPSDPASLLASAQAYRKKGDTPAVIIELRNLLELDPNHPEGRYLLGLSYLESGDATFATVELEKAMALGYDPKVVLPDLAKSLIAKEKFKEALDATDPANVASAQGSPEILNVRAFAQLGMRQLAAAKASLDLAMALRPDFADGMLSQARIALLEGDGAAATALVDRALASDAKSVDGWLLKGGMQLQSGASDLARVSILKAIEINPRSAAARLDLASLEIASKRYDEAASELEAAREIAPKNVMGVYLKALLELRIGNHKGALDSVYRALEIAPQHVPSMLLGGMAELALGHTQAAEKYLTTALDINPRNLYGRKVLATSQMQRKLYAEAIATMEPVLNQGVADPELLALAGEAYMQNGQPTKATQYFERAVSLDPQSVPARINLAMSRMASGAVERAMADLEAAAALGPTGSRADIMLAMMSMKRKDYDQALRTIGKLEKTQSDNTLVINMKATAYAGKGDLPQARANFERALKIDPGYYPAASNLAQLDLRAGNPQAARARFEGVLQKDKNQTQAMLALASLSSRAPGGEKEALDWIQRAKAAAPDSIAPFQAEIEYYRRTGQLEKALAIALEQKKQRPGDADALEMLGKLLVATGHTADAVAVYGERAIVLPNSPAALLDLAMVQLASKDPGSASNTLRKLLRLKPGHPEAQAALVAAELAQDRGMRALQVAREVQNDLPKAPLGYVLEGDVLVASKKYAQAAALYEKAYALNKSALVAIKACDAWVDAGKPDQGEARIKAWLAEQPADLATRRHLAYSRMQRGKYALAVEQYRLVLEKQPKDPVVLNNVAYALNKLKDPAALRYAQQAHELNPSDGAIADTLAQILLEKGEVAAGVDVLQKAIAVAPANREIRYHLAQALVKSGNKAKAISQLEIVIGSGSKFPQEAEALALLKQLRQ